MSDDHLDEQLHAYATQLQAVGRLPTPAEIRQLAHRRRQRRVAAAAFAVVLIGGLTLGLGVGRSPHGPNTPAVVTPVTDTPSPAESSQNSGPSPSPTAASASPSVDPGPDRPPKTTPATAKTVTSNVSQLRSLGIDLNVGVLIDVADDGLDRYLEIGAGGVVDFTGSSKTDNTMMALKPAQVAKNTESTKNRVVIAPPFYNEDVGPGQCVTDTAPGTLRLATCDVAAANQIWQVIPGGDSGLFELHGVHTDIRVDNGRITTGSQGYVGLQTITFASTP
jgi:hypothetical protein